MKTIIQGYPEGIGMQKADLYPNPNADFQYSNQQ